MTMGKHGIKKIIHGVINAQPLRHLINFFRVNFERLKLRPTSGFPKNALKTRFEMI